MTALPPQLACCAAGRACLHTKRLWFPSCQGPRLLLKRHWLAVSAEGRGAAIDVRRLIQACNDQRWTPIQARHSPNTAVTATRKAAVAPTARSREFASTACTAPRVGLRPEWQDSRRRRCTGLCSDRRGDQASGMPGHCGCRDRACQRSRNVSTTCQAIGALVAGGNCNWLGVGWSTAP